MLGSGAAQDEELVRSAVAGDDGAFGVLFERHLVVVFESAWQVLGDRWTAADVTAETFAAAWRELLWRPIDDVGETLADSARQHARYRLPIDEPGGEWAGEPDPGHVHAAPPSLGPVLRNRIVSALRADGVPVPANGPTLPEDHRSRPRWPLRLGVAALAVVILIAGVLILDRGDDTDEVSIDDFVAEDTTGESESTDPDDDRELEVDRNASTTTVDNAATSTTAAPTTTAEDDEDDEADDPPDDDDGDDDPPGDDPGNGTPPSTSPQTTTTAPATTTTTAPPPRPVVQTFGGRSTGDYCGYRRYTVGIWWSTEHATSVQLRPRGGDSVSVSVDGYVEACAELGTEWILNATNSAGTTTEVTTID